MSNCDKFCIPQSEYDPNLHELISTHATSSECAAACQCDSSSSSGCHFIECGGELVNADCGLNPNGNYVVDCEQCECVEVSSSSSSNNSESSSSDSNNGASSNTISSSATVNSEAAWFAQISNAYSAAYINYCTAPNGAVGPTPYPDPTYNITNMPQWSFLADTNNTSQSASINVGYETICGVNSKLAIQMSFFGLPVRGFEYRSNQAAAFCGVAVTYTTYPTGFSGGVVSTTITADYSPSTTQIYFNQDNTPVIGGSVEFLIDQICPGNTTNPVKIFLSLIRLRPIF